MNLCVIRDISLSYTWKVILQLYAFHSQEKGLRCKCRRNSNLEVVEYSEISAEQAAARDTWGRLQYNWSNVCMHYFSVAWLTKVVKHLEKKGARCAPPTIFKA